MRAKIKSIYRSVTNFLDTPAVILLYHRVTRLATDPQQLAVTPENFFEQVGLLKSKYTLLDMEELYVMLNSGKALPKNSIVLTFDDGYADNLMEAIPILENLRTTALFYISTSGLDTRFEFWWDNLERVFLLDHYIPEQLTLSTKSKTFVFPTATRDDRVKAYAALHPIIKNHCSPARDQLMEFILEWSGLQAVGRESHRVLTSHELIRLAHSKSAILGAHTHTHPKLSSCSYDQQVADINMSVEKLEKLTGRKIEYFSYPFGTRDDYNRDTLQICKSIGFKLVCANYGDAVHRWHPKLELPRVLVRNWSAAELNSVISPLLA